MLGLAPDGHTSHKSQARQFGRSEGLAVASLEMFKMGTFSSDPSQPFQVDATGLEHLTAESLAKGMQVSESNPMSGLEGRAGLLIRLAKALRNPGIFGPDGRPGNMIGKSNMAWIQALHQRCLSHWVTRLSATPDYAFYWQALETILQHSHRYKREECPRVILSIALLETVSNWC
jgi:hypothetical protein